MSGTVFFRGQQLGRGDIDINIDNQSGHPTNVQEITYALYDVTTEMEVLLGSPLRVPLNPSVGEYYASFAVPTDANLGKYRVRWTFRELAGGPVNTAVMNWTIIDRTGNVVSADMTATEADLVHGLRTLARDANPDRNYHFRPPTHEETVGQYNKVFGYIWEDWELKEFIEFSMDDISNAPPFVGFSSLDQMIQYRRSLRSLVLTGALAKAIGALQINAVADEFDYSIGGVSLNIDRSSKYDSIKSNAQEQFREMLTNFKNTLKYTKGLGQSKYGTGIRSSLGPNTGAGILTPAKFMGGW